MSSAEYMITIVSTSLLITSNKSAQPTKVDRGREIKKSCQFFTFFKPKVQMI